METWPTKRIVLLTLTVGTVLYLVYYVPGAIAHFVGRVWDVVVILILSTALAFVLAPAVEFVARMPIRVPLRTRRIIATLLVMGTVAWCCWLLIALTATQMIHELQGIITVFKSWLTTVPSEVQGWLDEYSAELPPGFIDRAGEAVAQWTQGLLQYQFDFAKGALLRGWYVVELLIIPVMAFYFLVDAAPLKAGALYLTPQAYRDLGTRVIDDVTTLLHSYVRAQVLLCLLKAVLVGLALYFCGVKVFLTLALIAGLFRMAPVVGPLIAAVPCVGVPMLQNGPYTGMVVLALYSALIFIDGKLLTPVVLAESATLHPVVVIVSLLLGYEFMGVLGLLIAVPVAGIIRTVYVRYHEAFLEGDGAPQQPQAG